MADKVLDDVVRLLKYRYLKQEITAPKGQENSPGRFTNVKWHPEDPLRMTLTTSCRITGFDLHRRPVLILGRSRGYPTNVFLGYYCIAKQASHRLGVCRGRRRQ